MFLEQISWKQAEEYFKKRDLAVIPVGSTENHGSQLALGPDFLIPRNLCERMDSRLNCLIAPTIPYGVADQHTHFPGTITIGYDGLYDLVTRIADQLYGHGIRHFVFLNGHGGNTPVLQRVCMELDDKHAVGCVLDWWINDEKSPAYKSRPELLYRTVEPGSPMPAFGITARTDTDEIFRMHLHRLTR